MGFREIQAEGICSPVWITPNRLSQVFQRAVQVLLHESEEPPVVCSRQGVGGAGSDRPLEQLLHLWHEQGQTRTKSSIAEQRLFEGVLWAVTSE